MKYGIKTEGGKSSLYVKYEGSEYEKLKEKLVALGLEVQPTNNAGGQAVSLEYYREATAAQRQGVRGLLNNGISRIADDINSNIITENGYFNIALFRVVPDSAGVARFPLPRPLSVGEVNDIGSRIASVYQALYSVVTDATATISISGVTNNG